MYVHFSIIVSLWERDTDWQVLWIVWSPQCTHIYRFPNLCLKNKCEFCILGKHCKIKTEVLSPPHPRGRYLICTTTACFILTSNIFSFTAASIHFESQCIPTSLAWYAHHLPLWFLKLLTVATFIIEIGLPPLFFSPVRSVRIVNFFLQVCNVFKHMFVNCKLL